MIDFKYLLPKSKLRCCGIYSLRNTITGKRYVGSSKDMYYRVSSHKSKLNRKCHDNQHLQNSCNIYGIDAFEVDILEKCNPCLLGDKEQHWIAFYNANKHGYNMVDVSEVRGNIVGRDTRKKLSKAGLKGKSVLMCDSGGEPIVRFDSLSEAAYYVVSKGLSSSKEFHVRMNISQAARSKTIWTGYGRKAVRKTAYGYRWKYV